jgi:ribonuclease HI
MTIQIYSDGASRGNPGISAIAFLILSEDRQVLLRNSKYIGIRTNNQAEYEAVIYALERASTLMDQSAICFLDSELVIKQLNGQYRVRNAELKMLWSTVQELAKRFQEIRFIHVPRTHRYMREVDQLANRTLDSMTHRL